MWVTGPVDPWAAVTPEGSPPIHAGPPFPDDQLDPDIQDELDAIVDEATRQAAILALIKTDGYAKAWISADAPFVFAKPRWGGAWTMQLGWSGASRAFGIVQPINLDRETARAAIQDWFDTEIVDRPSSLQVGGQVELLINAVGKVSFVLQNDSVIAFKSTQLSTLSSGYSRATWSNNAGTLYFGAEAHLPRPSDRRMWWATAVRASRRHPGADPRAHGRQARSLHADRTAGQSDRHTGTHRTRGECTGGRFPGRGDW